MMDLFGCLGWDNLDLKISVTWNENQIQAMLLLENLSTGFSPSSLLENEKKRKRIINNVIQSINLSKEVEEKKTAFSSTVINTLLSLMFKSHVNFASGNAVKHIGLLRNRNEDTVGMDGNKSEESWKAEFSLLLSLLLAQWPVLFPRSSPSGCSGLGQTDHLLGEPLPCESRTGQMKSQV